MNISYDIKKVTYLERYDCISNVPPKHKLVIFILDQVNIGFKLQEGIYWFIIFFYRHNNIINISTRNNRWLIECLVNKGTEKKLNAIVSK